MYCPECGHELTSKIEVDELSDGTLVGCRIYWCENCSEWFDQEEIDEYPGKSDQGCNGERMKDIDGIERIEFGCFSCGKMISCDSDLDCPSGAVVFDGGSNFGSVLYDSLMDGISVRILVCDDCLRAKPNVLRETMDKRRVFSSSGSVQGE